MQLETCHLGRVQGVQRTIHTGHTGARPRLSEEDKERLAAKQHFARETLRGRQWEGFGYDDYLLIKARFEEGLTQAQCAVLFFKDQSTICRWEERLLKRLREIFEGGA